MPGIFLSLVESVSVIGSLESEGVSARAIPAALAPRHCNLAAASRRLRKEMSRKNSRVRCARRVLLGVLCASFLLAPAAFLGAELKEETLNAWDAYIQKANAEMGDRLHGPFLWVEEVPDRMQRVRAGNILVWSVGQ